MTLTIVPAIIANSQRELDGMIKRLRGRVDRVMLDFMDGLFVENTSLNWDIQLTGSFYYEAHLMVVDPLERIEGLCRKINAIILHMETLDDVGAAINHTKSYSFQVSLALNPETSVDVVEQYLDEVDGVLVMTVAPGRYGGRFLPETLDKCRRIRMLNDSIQIQVDGGMNPENAKAARDAGANVIASGSYLMKSDDIDLALKLLSGEKLDNPN